MNLFSTGQRNLFSKTQHPLQMCRGITILALAGMLCLLGCRPFGLVKPTETHHRPMQGAFAILDISSPTKPSLAATLPLDAPITGKSDLRVADGKAYLVSSGNVFVVDVQNLQHPALVASLPLWGQKHSCDFSKAKHLLYIVNNRGLHILDVAQPHAPKFLAQGVMLNAVDSPQFRRISNKAAGLAGTDIAILGNNQILVTTTYSHYPHRHGFALLLDVTQPDKVKVLQTLHTAKNPTAIALANQNSFYIAGDIYNRFKQHPSFFIEDFRPETTEKLSAPVVDLAYTPEVAAGMEDEQFMRAFAAVQGGDRGALKQLMKLLTGEPSGTLYIATEHSFEIRSVPLQYRFSVGHFDSLHALALVGEVAYLAAGSEGIAIVDLAGRDPAMPRQPRIVAIFDSLPLAALALVADGKYLYVLYGKA